MGAVRMPDGTRVRSEDWTPARQRQLERQRGAAMVATAEAEGMIVLSIPLRIRGSIPGREITVGTRRTHECRVTAVNIDARKALTERGHIVDFDNIWVCDLNPLFQMAQANATRKA